MQRRCAEQTSIAPFAALSPEQRLYLANALMNPIWNGVGTGLGAAARRSPRRILCVKWDEIGDMLVCTHVFAALKKAQPQAELHVLCKPFVAGMLELDPHVDRVLTSVSEWNSRYDWVFELRGTWATFWKSFRYWPALRRERGSVRWKNRGQQRHEMETNSALLQGLPGVSVEEPELFISQDLQQWGEAKAREWGPFVAVHPGGRSLLRRWPAVRYARLCDWLQQEQGLNVLLLGSEEERELLESIRSLCSSTPRSSLELESNSLLHTYSLLLQARLFVGNESGPLQLADRASAAGSTLGILALYGPGVKDVFYPRSLRSRILHEVLPCNPCDQVHCVRPDDTCMMRISEAQVWAAVQELLSLSAN